MKTLAVGGGSSLIVSSGLLSNPKFFQDAVAGPTALLVAGSGVPEQWSLAVGQTLNQLSIRWQSYEITDGEAAKTLDTISGIWDFLLSEGHGRDTTLIALGGGVTGDMVGYAAACYQRGVRWMNLPTTLLAQVDASIGGKTGVNHALGKNMIGAFHPPTQVLADLDTLRTLPEREFRAGLAEVIKHGVLAGERLLSWLEQQMHAILAQDAKVLEEAIFTSCEVKAGVVERDLKETGERALLNLGHSFAHAIETHQNYAGMTHGEAVAVGLVMAARCSETLLDADPVIRERITALLQTADLPTTPPEDMTAEDFLRHMQLDKKTKGGKMRLVLLDNAGKARLHALSNEDSEQVQQLLRKLTAAQ